jgi:hypothetical protein
MTEAVAAAKAYLNDTLSNALQWGDLAMLNQGLGLPR